MDRLLSISKYDDIPVENRDTPVGMLLEYHNLNRPYDNYDSARLLVGMCMDNRKHLHIPDNFSYIIRTGAANLRYSEFKVSYAIAVGNIRHIVLIGHSKCGMVNLFSRREQFVEGLVEGAGWQRERAEEHFLHYGPMFEIVNEIDFVLVEARRLRLKYPKITIVPMFYKVEDNKLYLVKEE